MERIFEWLSLLFGGVVGWVVGKFEPAFPLIIIATLFVLYDAWSAYELDKRVHIMHPQKTKRTQAKFVSYKFRQVIPTLIERFVIIILAYCVERWVFVHIDVPVWCARSSCSALPRTRLHADCQATSMPECGSCWRRCSSTRQRGTLIQTFQSWKMIYRKLRQR